MEIQYIKGDLFSDKEATLLHACNCRRTWGRGVAATFAKLFPNAYAEHKEFDAQPGDIQVIRGPQPIVCLFTSDGYGKATDEPAVIVRNTETALRRLGLYYMLNFCDQPITIASPKINAGLFRVPWHQTEQLILKFLLENQKITWKVYYVEDH